MLDTFADLFHGASSLFDRGWVGSLIGLTGLIAAIFFYFFPRSDRSLSCQMASLRLIGFARSSLPSQADVRFQGQSVVRISKTHVVLWNSGRNTISREDIASTDPLRLIFSDGGKILQASILSVTRDVNKFSLEAIDDGLVFDFSFLDKGDGAAVEILHTSEDRYPQVIGTIKGLPSGINFLSNYRRANGSSLNTSSLKLPNRKTLYVIMIFIGAITSLSGLLIPDRKLTLANSTHDIRLVLVLAGFFYLLLPLFGLWLGRRRYPSGITIESLDG